MSLSGDWLSYCYVGRTLVLAEKGGELEIITALPEFRIVATMNPAGDYGKKEVSLLC